MHVYEDSSPLSRAYAAFGKGSFYESVIAFNESIDADPVSYTHLTLPTKA